MLLHPNTRAVRPARGLAATAAALLLFFAMGLLLAFTNRSLIFEQRTSANQYRYTKAFEAAEAGLEWTIAQLNQGLKVNTSCVIDATGANGFMERYMAVDGNGNITPGALSPVCVIPADGSAYQCSCPTAGNAAASGTAGAAFKVLFSAAPTAGIVNVTVQGCTSQAGTCDPAGGGATPDGTAKVSVQLGVLPALGTGPAAAVTAKRNVSWQGAAAALGVVNTETAYNGITINAGGTIDTAKIQATTVQGSPAASSLIPSDPSLSSPSTDEMFVSFFGMSKAEYKAMAQASGTYVTCPSNCTSTITNAVAAASAQRRFFWVEGDMDTSSNISLGSVASPVIIVVNGNISSGGNSDVTGLLYSAYDTGALGPCTDASTSWNNTGGGSFFLRGAAVSECNFKGNGTPNFLFDPNVLRTPTPILGAFSRVPGSWKDY